MEITTSKDNPLPIEYSARGDNAYYIDTCEVVGHSPSYAVCLHKIRAAQEDKGKIIYLNCTRKINGAGCKATRMQRQEIAEGRALFYRSREEQRAEIDALAAETQKWIHEKYGGNYYSGGGATIGKRVKRATSAPTPAPAPVKSESVLDGIAGDYAAAISKAAKTLPEKFGPLPEPVPYVDGEGNSQVCVARSVEAAPTVAPAGGSALERARAMLAARSK